MSHLFLPVCELLESRCLLSAATVPDRAGGSFDTARDMGTIAVGQSRGTADNVGLWDQDFYRFQVGADTSITIDLTQLTADANMDVLDSAGNRVALSSKPGLGSERISQALASGTYILRVFAPGAATNYRVTFTAASAAAQFFKLAASLNTLAAPSSFSIFVWIPGIPGDSQDAVRQDFIEAQAYSWGIAVTPPTSPGGQPGRAVFNDFAIAKSLDRASPKLFERAANGQFIDQVTISLVGQIDGRNREFMRFTLSVAFVTAFDTSGSAGGGATQENVRFSYQKIQLTYWAFDEFGNRLPPVTAAWDLAANKAV